jgi:hypothetical protein
LNSWEAAFSKISRRGLFDVIDELDLEPPFEFSFTDATSDIPALIDDELTAQSPPLGRIIDLPGRDVALATDSLVCLTKFLHVVQSSRANARRGAITWSIVDAYHASLLGARALCAFMGIIPYTVRGRTALIDYRPEFGTPQDRIKFRKQHGRPESPVALLVPKTAHLEQADLWKLVRRSLQFAKLNETRKEFDEVLAALDASAGSLRNAVLYDALTWTRKEDSSTLREPYLSIADINAALAQLPAPTALFDSIFLLVQDCAMRFKSRVTLRDDTLPRSIVLAPEPHVLAA